MTELCGHPTNAGPPCKNRRVEGLETCKKHGRALEPHSKLSDTVITALCDGLRLGNYRDVVIRSAGISGSTFYRWMEVGEADHESDKDTLHAQLWVGVQKAETEAEMNAVKTLTTGAASDPATAAQFLERRYPSRWAKMRKVEVTGAGGGAIKSEVSSGAFAGIDPADLTPEAREEIAEILDRERQRQTEAEQAASGG